MSQLSRKIISLALFIILPLLAGTAFYIFFREYSGIKNIVEDILNLPKGYIKPVNSPLFISNTLPDLLWMFAFSNLIIFVWDKEMNRNTLIWVIIAYIGAVTYELFQLNGWVAGTFDIMDIIAYTLGFLLSNLIFMINFKKLQMNHKLKTVLSSIAVVGFLAMAIASGDEKDKSDGSVKDSKEEKADTKKIEILQHNAKADEFGNITIFCEVKNNTDKLATYVEVDATFKDENGGVVGKGMGNTTNLAAGKTRTIEVLALDVTDAANYTVEVEDMMFDGDLGF